MSNINVNLRPVITDINLPTVIKSAFLPNDNEERLFVATQVGEIYYLGNGELVPFLDIRDQIIELGVQSGGYDERGLLGLAFHPDFYMNGLFYIHYSVAGSQGPGALADVFMPSPCDLATLDLEWEDREIWYDHIDTIEEWIVEVNGRVPQKRRTILNIRRPFMNHNGVNSLNFSPETGNLIFSNGDGGDGYDPFNLSQNFMEIAGKIIEVNVDIDINIPDMPVVSRFDEIPVLVQESIMVMANGIRNPTGIVYQWSEYEQYIKYVGNVGQELVESIYSFTYYTPIPVIRIVENDFAVIEPESEGFINFGWRGWEGDLPTTVIVDCPDTYNPIPNAKIIAYYDDVVDTSSKRMYPIVNYFHEDPRPDKFEGSAITGVHPYMGKEIPELTEAIVFTDFARQSDGNEPRRGILGYTRVRPDCHPNDFFEINPNYDFGNKSSYFMSLGTNIEQTQMFIGVYGSANVADYNMGTIFEIIP